MKVLVVNATDLLDEVIFNSKADVIYTREGAKINDVVNINRYDDHTIKITYLDASNIPDSICCSELDFTELRVYIN